MTLSKEDRPMSNGLVYFVNQEVGMEICRIRQQEWETVKDLIAVDFLRKGAVVFAAVDSGKVIGVLVMEEGEREYSVSVLWVHPEHRREHAATKLLDKAIGYACQKDAEELNVSYNPDLKEAYILDYMLCKKRFQVETEKLPRYYLTKESLLNSPLFMELKEKNKKNAGIVPFGRLTTYQLKEMQDRLLKNGIHMVNRINLLEVDGKRSRVLLIDDTVQGMVLFKRKPNPTELELLLFFVYPSHAAAGIPLLLQASDVLLEERGQIKGVEFVCVNARSATLAKKILGNTIQEYTSMCHATLDLYRVMHL